MRQSIVGSLLKNFKVRTKLYLLLLITFIGVFISGVYSYNSLVTYSVNGPVYNQIQQNETLIADILPPPVFIVESYLNAYQLLETTIHPDESEISALRAEADILRQKYETQRAFWEQTLAEGEIRRILLQEAVVQANVFYEVYDQEFIPAVVAGNREEADRILHDKLEPSYLSHRAAIEQVVSLAGEQNEQTEIAAATDVAASINLASILGTGTAVIIILVSLGIGNSIVQPIVQINETASQIAQGDLSQDVVVDSQDEIGDLGRSFNLMTSRLRHLVNTLEEQVQKRTEALSRSTEIGRFLSTILDEQELLSRFITQLHTSLRYEHVRLYLFNQTQNSLLLYTEMGNNQWIDTTHLLQEQSYIGQVIQTNSSRLLSNLSHKTNADAVYLLPDTKQAAWIPVSQGDTVLGVLDVQSSQDSSLGQTDIDLLQAVANQLAVSLQNARTYGEAQNRAQQEALINRINEKIDAAQSIEGVLQIAIRELGHALQVKQTNVRLQNKTAVTPNR